MLNIDLHPQCVELFSLEHAVVFGILQTHLQELAEGDEQFWFVPFELFEPFGINRNWAAKLLMDLYRDGFVHRFRDHRTGNKWVYSLHPISEEVLNVNK